MDSIDEETKATQTKIYKYAFRFCAFMAILASIAYIAENVLPILINYNNINFLQVILTMYVFFCMTLSLSMDCIFFGCMAIIYCQIITLKRKIDLLNLEWAGEEEKFQEIINISAYYSKIIRYKNNCTINIKIK